MTGNYAMEKLCISTAHHFTHDFCPLLLFFNVPPHNFPLIFRWYLLLSVSSPSRPPQKRQKRSRWVGPRPSRGGTPFPGHPKGHSRPGEKARSGRNQLLEGLLWRQEPHLRITDRAKKGSQNGWAPTETCSSWAYGMRTRTSFKDERRVAQ